MPDASPTKWHLAHGSWFFETFLLIPHLSGYTPFDKDVGYLFNSYYESVGPRIPRAERSLLTRPSAGWVMAYRAHVDTAMERLLEQLQPTLVPIVELGIAHEEQHQELIIMDILHLFSRSPIGPAYRSNSPHSFDQRSPMQWRALEGGLVEIGAEAQGFAFDNERPRHKVFLQSFSIADRLVTNAEWLAFMEDGGYQRPQFWLADGWAKVRAEGWLAPLYWHQVDGRWLTFTLRGSQAVDPNAPAQHVSYYEAAAYAEWTGARLPTEMEWEHAAADHPDLRDLAGQSWQWTSSAYSAYPGFKASQDAVGEYNGKFMSGQMILRGGSWATPNGHTRTTYRNFFYPWQRWMFSGVRLAKDTQPEASNDYVSFQKDVLAGLSNPNKALSPKYLYDEKGSSLFEALCLSPEYYLTRTELELLKEVAGEIAGHFGNHTKLVEFGSGASHKTRILLDACKGLSAYIPIDISGEALNHAVADIRSDYPAVEVAPIRGDFTQLHLLERMSGEAPIVGFFPGSTIGNLSQEEAISFFEDARRFLGENAFLLVGADLVKDQSTLLAAYDDSGGTTAAFNKNLLQRINRELQGTFDLNSFHHRAAWNSEDSSVEMWLVSAHEQCVEVSGRFINFSAGEGLHTESSRKYTIESFSSAAESGGWRVVQRWVSEAPEFALFLLSAA